MMKLDATIMTELKGTRFEQYLRTRDFNPYIWTHLLEKDKGNITYGFSLPDNWKFDYIGKMVDETSMGKMGIYMGEFGIEKALKLAEESWATDEEIDLDEGDEDLKRLFHAVLFEIFQTIPELQPIQKEEYDKYVWQIGNDDDE